MSGVIQTNPKAQFFKDNGHVAANYKLYTYVNLTTNSATTWQDLNQSTANTNPITLDARGECLLWLDPAVVYSLVLKTNSGATVWTVDNVSGAVPGSFYAVLAGSGGSALVGFLQAGTGAEVRTVQSKLRDVVSVKDYGAVGDGSTDDTAAIQAAIDYAATLRNVEVFFPHHDAGDYYKTTAPLTITNAVSLRGETSATTILSTGLTSAQYVVDYNCLAADVIEQISISHLTLRTNNSVASALRLKNASYVTVKDVRVYNVLHGVMLEGTRCFSNAFEQLNSYGVTGNTVRFAAGFTGGGHFTFNGSTFTGDTGFVLPSTAASDSLAFVGCNFEQCVANSLYIGGSARGVSVLGCRTEGCNGDDFQINPGAGESVEGITITGTSFTTDSGASRPIVLGGAGGTVRGFSITGNQVEYAGLGTSFVYLNGEGESGLVTGNYFAQTNTTPINVQRAGVIVFGNENSSGKCAEYWGTADWGVAQGSWTPIDASGAGLTFSSATGRYTKIGRTVFWQAHVVYPATASGAGGVIGGLPYSVNTVSGSAGRAGGHVDISNVGSAVGIFQGVTSATTLDFYSPTAITPITNATLSGKELYMSGTYIVS